MQQLTFRLSDGRRQSIEFEANSPASFARACQAAWLRWRTRTASHPGYFEAMQRINALRHELAPDLDGTNRPAKLAEWASRGHDTEAAERLWDKLVCSRKMQFSNAQRREADHLLPEYLEIHIASIYPASELAPEQQFGQWFHPARAPGGVRLHADMRLIALEEARVAEWGWHQTWDAFYKVYAGERAILQMLSTGHLRVKGKETPKVPVLTLVTS